MKIRNKSIVEFDWYYTHLGKPKRYIGEIEIIEKRNGTFIAYVNKDRLTDCKIKNIIRRIKY